MQQVGGLACKRANHDSLKLSQPQIRRRAFISIYETGERGERIPPSKTTCSPAHLRSRSSTAFPSSSVWNFPSDITSVATTYTPHTYPSIAESSLLGAGTHNVIPRKSIPYHTQTRPNLGCIQKRSRLPETGGCNHLSICLPACLLALRHFQFQFQFTSLLACFNEEGAIIVVVVVVVAARNGRH